jgi:hypothetical protein
VEAAEAATTEQRPLMGQGLFEEAPPMNGICERQLPLMMEQTFLLHLLPIARLRHLIQICKDIRFSVQDLGEWVDAAVLQRTEDEEEMDIGVAAVEAEEAPNRVSHREQAEMAETDLFALRYTHEPIRHHC